MPSLQRALLITFASNNGSAAVNFAVTIVLARLLSPHEIGIFSITMVLISIAHIFRDFGVTAYLQREKELTPEKIRAASGVLIASSWLIALILFVISPWAADYFAEAGVKPVMQVLALGFVFIPLGAITNALMTREYRAKEQAYLAIAGTSAYAISSITFALLGFSYMSMAWANLVNIIATGLASTPFRPSYAPWLPSLKGWRSVMHFGTGSVLSNVVGSINNAFSDLFLGKFSNASNVGLYSRANGTANIFMQVAGPTVNYAALTHLAQTYHAQGNISPQLSKATAYLSVLAWPTLGITALFAREVILFLYGEKWLECVAVVPLTCAIIAVSLSVHFLSVSLTAVGRPYLAIIPNLILLAARALTLYVVYDGSLFSFALGMLYGSLLSVPLYLLIQQKHLHFSLAEYIAAHVGSFKVASCILLAGGVIHYALPANTPSGITLLVVGGICTPLWLACLQWFDHPFRHELKNLFGSRTQNS